MNRPRVWSLDIAQGAHWHDRELNENGPTVVAMAVQLNLTEDAICEYPVSYNVLEKWAPSNTGHHRMGRVVTSTVRQLVC